MERKRKDTMVLLLLLSNMTLKTLMFTLKPIRSPFLMNQLAPTLANTAPAQGVKYAPSSPIGTHYASNTTFNNDTPLARSHGPPNLGIGSTMFTIRYTYQHRHGRRMSLSARLQSR